MPGDNTILEGPNTPAPLFAYRAIRSIFFASPDASPEHAHAHANKENVAPFYAESSKSRPVPDTSIQQSTPPKKAQHGTAAAVLSPTKGILRTPGLATPRAKFLRDINVKFKSVSPEAVDKAGNLSAATATASTTTSSQTIRPSKSMDDMTPRTKTRQNKPHRASMDGSACQKAPSTVSTCPVDVLSRPEQLDAYVAQTEREMKKVLQYGQKMREYARKVDAENQELKRMIRQLRQENERLRSVVDDTGSKRGSASKNPGGAVGVRSPGYVRKEVVRVEATVRNQKDGQRRRRSDQTPHNGEAHHPRDRLPSGLEPPLPSTSVPPTAAVATPSTNTATGTARLPPDRVAAVRARLRAKAEARKASYSDFDPGPPPPNETSIAADRHRPDETHAGAALEDLPQSIVWEDL